MIKSLTKLELLSPARNCESGIAAINCGADAVYIGAPKFGARAAAGNSIADIEQLINYAHRYYSRVYITLNTILYNKELDEAEKLINRLYEIGADAVIVQDFSILTMNIPPIPLYASTQTNNRNVEKVSFLEKAGFSRVILARELSLEQIRKIKTNTNIELEFFIHGALCVCYSGQCYFSFASTGRSANRGECSQPCRMLYDLVDSKGNIIVKDKYLLSLKDLNLSLYLNDLIDAGVTSFKIEGRLKDINYVKNITAHYRQRIDDLLLNKPGFVKSSSGKVKLFFTPDPGKSFNRGFTEYFIEGKENSLSSFHTPKSIGKEIGAVKSIHRDYIEIASSEKIVNGDGLCYFNEKDELTGMNINRAEGAKLYPNEMRPIKAGTILYRNNDLAFEKSLAGKYAERKIPVNITITEEEKSFIVSAIDEEYNRIEFEWVTEKSAAEKEEASLSSVKKQLGKSGDSIFIVDNIDINFKQAYFFALSRLNELRRKIFSLLEQERNKNRHIEKRISTAVKPELPANELDYRANVTNKKSEEYYSDSGALNIEPGLELQNNFNGKVLMTCKYCIKNELNICPIKIGNQSGVSDPLYLVDKKRKYRLSFDCDKCEMSVLY